MQPTPRFFGSLISALLTPGASRLAPEAHSFDDIGYEAAAPCLQAALWREMTRSASTLAVPP